MAENETTLRCSVCGGHVGSTYDSEHQGIQCVECGEVFPVEGLLANVASALDSLDSVVAFSARDWSQDPNDAWLYAIICGWGNAALDEVAKKHRWSNDGVRRLGEYRKAVEGVRDAYPVYETKGEKP